MNKYFAFLLLAAVPSANFLVGCGSNGESETAVLPTPTARVVVVVATPTPSQPGPTPSSTSTGTMVPVRIKTYFDAYMKCMGTVLAVEKKLKTASQKADLSEAKATLSQAQTDYMYVPVPAEFAKADSLLMEGMRLEGLAYDLQSLAIDTNTPSKEAEENFLQAGEVFHRANDEVKRVMELMTSKPASP